MLVTVFIRICMILTHKAHICVVLMNELGRTSSYLIYIDFTVNEIIWFSSLDVCRKRFCIVSEHLPPELWGEYSFLWNNTSCCLSKISYSFLWTLLVKIKYSFGDELKLNDAQDQFYLPECGNFIQERGIKLIAGNKRRIL